MKLVKTAPRSDVIVLVLSFALTVLFDLVVAIEIGLLLACLLFMKRMSDETAVRSWVSHRDKTVDASEAERLVAIPDGVRVYDITDPLFFGAADRIADIRTKHSAKHPAPLVIILRMGGVPAVDATAMNALEGLYERCQKQGIQLLFSHVGEQPMRTMIKAGFVDLVGPDHFCTHLDTALNMAARLIVKDVMSYSDR